LDEKIKNMNYGGKQITAKDAVVLYVRCLPDHISRIYSQFGGHEFCDFGIHRSHVDEKINGPRRRNQLNGTTTNLNH